MWGSIMAVNSFFVWPLTFIFLIYSIGRMVLFFDWKVFLIGAILFALSTAAQMVIGVLSE
jgi:hypothetical protein